MAGQLIEFNEGNFENEVIQASVPVLVDFWAPWCGPCRQITPLIEQLANENASGVKVGKLNVDDAQGIAQSYGVNQIPTIMIFKNGQVVDRFLGIQPKAKLQQAMEAAKA